MRVHLTSLTLVAVAAACGDPQEPELPVGSLQVAVATSGGDIDLDGYGLGIDGGAERAVGVNETVVIPEVPAGPHEVTLMGVAENCTVDGGAVRTITVTGPDMLRIPFTVRCRATGLVISVGTSGLDLDPDGYAISINGATQAVDVNARTTRTRMAPGTHTVALSGLADNCAVAGSDTRTVTLAVGQLGAVFFDVTCVATTGAVAVSGATAGLDLDADGYQLQVGDQPFDTLPVNGEVIVEGLRPGDLEVVLADVAPNCAVLGENPRMVTVTAGALAVDTVETTFEITCVAARGVVEVTATTSGLDHDLDGYLVVLDDLAPQPVGANAIQTFDVGGGDHVVRLDGVASNCTLEGNDARVVTVSTGGTSRDTARVSFDIACVETFLIAFSRATPVYFYGDVPTISMTLADGSAQASVVMGDAPDWSPDGTALVFVAMACDDYCYPDGLATLTLDGSDVTRLTADWTDADPTWRPDGGRIAFVRGDTLHLMNPDGSGVTAIPAAGRVARPAWSPDGTTLAFTCEVADGNQDICVIAADGTGFARLTSDPGRDTDPAWKPDGSTIAFTTTRYTGSSELAVMNADGSAVTRMAPDVGATQPAWSPDGTQFVFARFTCDIATGCALAGLWKVNADGTGLAPITSGSDQSPAWRP